MSRWTWTFVGVASLFALAQKVEAIRAPSSVSAPGVLLESPDKYSKVFAMSDAHGMFSNLVPLLQTGGIVDSGNHWAAGKALLIVIGDSIDKGPDSVDVIDLWIQLAREAEASGGKVVHLLGNHEAEFLSDSSHDKKAKEFLKELASKKISPSEFSDPSKPRGQFMLSMQLAAVVGKWLFCHAGFLPAGQIADLSKKASDLISQKQYGDDLFIGTDSILEAKAWWATGSDTRQQLEGRLSDNSLNGVVFGHQPSALNVKGADAISDDGRLIKIDNGMAPEAGAHPGSLLVFTQPQELGQAAAPHVVTLRSGDSSPQPLPHEVAGPPSSDGDE